MPDPAISALIAVYEAQTTICRAIESVLAHPDAEVVLAPDDGKRYAWLLDLFPRRMRLLEPSLRQGPSYGRNRAAARAKGRYFTMLDCDDRFEPQALHQALEGAERSFSRVSFLRTRYVYSGSEQACREFPEGPTILWNDFVDFHGSVHAFYSRDRWQPYADYRISQDVLHDAGMLLACGGEAPLTRAAYIQYLQPLSITATARQPEFNDEYSSVVAAARNPAVAELFREKLRVGGLYMRALQQQPDLNFHEFVRGGLP